ncbi:hypothetical protein [Salinibacterium sp. ZJ77]|uniref:hypothetical protein n=1 Tax=Salinibacterium sp. ZJ77 TaxID=2708337 RepID=UPI001421CA9B|nr:hypothetical protein [Salinibacterium sp. ZJ77]
MDSRRTLALVAAPLALTLALSACTVAETVYDFPAYSSWGEVVESADLVVVGTVIEVAAVIAGDARQGEQIEVSMPGTKRTRSGHPPPGEIDADALVLALAAFPCSPLHPTQAVFGIGDDGTVLEPNGDAGFLPSDVNWLEG